MAAPQMGRKFLLFPNRTELAQGSTMLASIENFRCPGGSLALHKCPLSLPTGLKLPLLLEQDLIKEQSNFCYLLKTQIMVSQSANCKISLHSFCSLGGWHNQITTNPQHTANLSCSLDVKKSEGLRMTAPGWTPRVIGRQRNDGLDCLALSKLHQRSWSHHASWRCPWRPQCTQFLLLSQTLDILLFLVWRIYRVPGAGLSARAKDEMSSPSWTFSRVKFKLFWTCDKC